MAEQPLSVFGVPGSKSFLDKLDEAKEAGIVKRGKQAKRYTEWRTAQAELGTKMTAKDMYAKRMELTGGDTIMASFLGDRASDNAMAIRTNEDIQTRILGEVTGQLEAQAKNQKMMVDNVDPDHENFDTFLKGLHQVSKVKHIPGQIDPKVQSILDATKFDKSKWQDEIQKKRRLSIAETAAKDNFKLNIRTDEDINSTFSGEKSWKLKGLKSALAVQEKQKMLSAMKTALVESAKHEIQDIRLKSDPEIVTLADSFLKSYFADFPGGVPKGAEWEGFRNSVINTFKSQRNSKQTLYGRDQKISFIKNWNAHPQLKMIFENKANTAASFTMQNLHDLADEIAIQSDMPKFDWGKGGDGQQKFAALLGDSALRRVMRVMTNKKEALALSKLTDTAKVQVERERDTYKHELTSAIAVANSNNKQLWGSGDKPASIAAIRIANEFRVANLPELMSDITKILTSNPQYSADQVYRSITKEQPFQAKTWDAYERNMINAKTDFMLVGDKTDVFAQINNYVKVTQKHLKELSDKITDGPVNARTMYGKNLDKILWVKRGGFDHSLILRDWHAAMDKKRDRVVKTFGNRDNHHKWNWRDVHGQTRRLIPTEKWWLDAGNGEITQDNMKGLTEYMLEKVKRERAAGVITLNSLVPEGKKALPDQPVSPAVKLAPNQLEEVRRVSRSAGAELSSILEIASLSLHRGPRPQGFTIDPKKGLDLRQFLTGFGGTREKYTIPAAWISGDAEAGKVSNAILSNAAIKEMAVSIVKMSLNEENEHFYAGQQGANRENALKVLRSLIFFGAAVDPNGVVIDNSDHPFFKASQGSFFTTSPIANHAAGGPQISDLFTGDMSVYDTKLGMLIKGEKNFFNQIYDLGLAELAAQETVK
jgi:hypothetical protein